MYEGVAVVDCRLLLLRAALLLLLLSRDTAAMRLLRLGYKEIDIFEVYEGGTGMLRPSRALLYGTE